MAGHVDYQPYICTSHHVVYRTQGFARQSDNKSVSGSYVLFLTANTIFTYASESSICMNFNAQHIFDLIFFTHDERFGIYENKTVSFMLHITLQRSNAYTCDEAYQPHIVRLKTQCYMLYIWNSQCQSDQNITSSEAGQGTLACQMSGHFFLRSMQIGLFLRVRLTIFQHWFRWWLGANQATSH